jgi:hypothetical protein
MKRLSGYINSIGGVDDDAALGRPLRFGDDLDRKSTWSRLYVSVSTGIFGYNQIWSTFGF